MLAVGMKLVLEAIAGTAGAGAGRIPSLRHEVGDDAVESHAVVETRSGQVDEVLYCQGRLRRVQVDLDPCAIAKLQGRRVAPAGVKAAVWRRGTAFPTGG